MGLFEAPSLAEQQDDADDIKKGKGGAKRRNW